MTEIPATGGPGPYTITRRGRIIQLTRANPGHPNASILFAAADALAVADALVDIVEAMGD